jgi:hypothetical protein
MIINGRNYLGKKRQEKYFFWIIIIILIEKHNEKHVYSDSQCGVSLFSLKRQYNVRKFVDTFSRNYKQEITMLSFITSACIDIITLHANNEMWQLM